VDDKPVTQYYIKLKTLLIYFKHHNGVGWAYLSSLLEPFTPPSPGLRSWVQTFSLVGQNYGIHFPCIFGKARLFLHLNQTQLFLTSKSLSPATFS